MSAIQQEIATTRAEVEQGEFARAHQLPELQVALEQLHLPDPKDTE
jgi:hypothetical protein